MVWAGLKPSDELEDTRPTRHSFWNAGRDRLRDQHRRDGGRRRPGLRRRRHRWDRAGDRRATFVMVTSGILLGRVLGAAIGSRGRDRGRRDPHRRRRR
jgi:hypothetical protein